MVDLSRQRHRTARLLDLGPRPSGHRNHRGDPLYRICNILRAGRECATAGQQTRQHTAFAAHGHPSSAEATYQCAQDTTAMFHKDCLAQGKRLAAGVIGAQPTCTFPESVRLGRALRTWRTTILIYLATDRSSNSGVEAVNGIIELGRRITHGCRVLERTDAACC